MMMIVKLPVSIFCLL